MRLLRELRWASARHLLAARFRAPACVPREDEHARARPRADDDPLAYGPTRNPWDTSRSPGGRAALGRGGVGMSGRARDDGGGSIRIPASECGLVGLKPSRGRTSMGPTPAEGWAGSRSSTSSPARCGHRGRAGCRRGLPAGDPYPRRPRASLPEEVGTPPGRLRIGVMLRTPTASSSSTRGAHRAARPRASSSPRAPGRGGHPAPSTTRLRAGRGASQYA